MMRQFRIHRLGALLLGSALAVLLNGVVLAHAQLKTPNPADKSTSTQPVTVVTGIFTQRVKADGSKLVIKLVGGATVAQ